AERRRGAGLRGAGRGLPAARHRGLGRRPWPDLAVLAVPGRLVGAGPAVHRPAVVGARAAGRDGGAPRTGGPRAGHAPRPGRRADPGPARPAARWPVAARAAWPGLAAPAGRPERLELPAARWMGPRRVGG